MATIDVMTFNFSGDTQAAMKVVRLLRPLVWLRLLSVERAVSIAMKSVKVSVTPASRAANSKVTEE